MVEILSKAHFDSLIGDWIFDARELVGDILKAQNSVELHFLAEDVKNHNEKAIFLIDALRKGNVPHGDWDDYTPYPSSGKTPAQAFEEKDDYISNVFAYTNVLERALKQRGVVV